MMFALLAGAILGGVAVLLLQGRRNERNALRAWIPLLTPQREMVLTETRTHFHDSLALFDIAYGRASMLRELGSTDEARKLLQAGYHLLDRFTPDLFRLLSIMASYSRMVSAMVPVKPIPPERLRTSSASAAARLAVVIHHLLVTTAERFRFKLYVIGQSLRLVSHALARSTRRIVNREPEAEREWSQIEDIRSDFKTLAEESLDSFRALLMSLDADRNQRRKALVDRGGIEPPTS